MFHPVAVVSDGSNNDYNENTINIELAISVSARRDRNNGEFVVSYTHFPLSLALAFPFSVHWTSPKVAYLPANHTRGHIPYMYLERVCADQRRVLYQRVSLSLSLTSPLKMAGRVQINRGSSCFVLTLTRGTLGASANAEPKPDVDVTALNGYYSRICPTYSDIESNLFGTLLRARMCRSFIVNLEEASVVCDRLKHGKHAYMSTTLCLFHSRSREIPLFASSIITATRLMLLLWLEVEE